ncbi:hypothetical protein AMJ85_04350 [candidate division BRC1 bacterium SM23_51]|nr:MAG: hypothetical protein AMJ85_04350 [candidate division BRC1 bacterium SM23_51]
MSFLSTVNCRRKDEFSRSSSFQDCRILRGEDKVKAGLERTVFVVLGSDSPEDAVSRQNADLVEIPVFGE